MSATPITPYENQLRGNGQGSLELLMDRLVELEETVDDSLRIYRWRPLAQIEPPCLYNWMPNTSPFEWRDTARGRDTFTIIVRICIRPVSEVEEKMPSIEAYVDQFRAIVDPALHHTQPLNGSAHKVTRTGVRLVQDTFEDAAYLAAEFPIECELDRIIV